MSLDDCRAAAAFIESERTLAPEQRVHVQTCLVCLHMSVLVSSTRLARLSRIMALTAQESFGDCLAFIATVQKREVNDFYMAANKMDAHAETCAPCRSYREQTTLVTVRRPEVRAFRRLARLMLEARPETPFCRVLRETVRAKGDSSDESLWNQIEVHSAACVACALYVALIDNPFNEREQELLASVVDLNRVWRDFCPSLDELRPAQICAGLVSAHLTHCDLCQDERRRLLNGEDVKRRLPFEGSSD